MKRGTINALRWQDKLKDAIEQITPEVISELTYNGAEIELNSFFTLQMHTEEELVTIVQNEDWVEVADVLIDDEDNITFDILDEEFFDLF